MVNVVTRRCTCSRERASAHVAAAGARAAKGDRAVRRHEPTGDPALAVRQSPGLSLRELAAEEGISPPAMSGSRRPARATGLIERVRSAEDRRRVGLVVSPGRNPPAAAGARAADGVARRAPGRARAGTSSKPSRPRSSRCGGCCDGGGAGAPPADVQQPSPPPQLPALLRRPGHLGVGIVDAEHRARLARARALALTACGRRARASAASCPSPSSA